MKVLLFGCGFQGKELYQYIDHSNTTVLAFLDNRLHGSSFDGVEIVHPKMLSNYKYDKIIITPECESLSAEIEQQLYDYGVSEEKFISLRDTGKHKDYVHLMRDGIEYRRGCGSLGELIVFSASHITPCCVSAYGKRIEYEDKILTVSIVRRCIQEFRSWVSKTIELLCTDKPTDCDGCTLLKWGYYPKNPEIKRIVVGGGFVDTVCNCRCIYCHQTRERSLKTPQTLTGYDIYRIGFDEFGDSIKSVVLADGEITALPHCDKLLELVIENGWSAYIVTNAIIYNEKLARILNRPNSALNVSIDAGTAETYRKIKGLDAFSEVLSNLERYAKVAPIELKYILLPGINDAFEDVNGFISIAKGLNVCKVILSHDSLNMAKAQDSNATHISITEPQYAMYCYFAARCKEEGLPVFYAYDYFLKDDCTRMDIICAPQ